MARLTYSVVATAVTTETTEITSKNLPQLNDKIYHEILFKIRQALHLIRKRQDVHILNIRSELRKVYIEFVTHVIETYYSYLE